MRCPKCGYISFDHVEKCLKCMKNIKDTSDNLHGTVFHAKAPSFLHFSNRREEKQENNKVSANRQEADDDFLDEDLEVLVQDESEIEAGDGEVIRDGEKSLAEGDDSEDREIEMDLSGFESAEDLKAAPAETESIVDQARVAAPQPEAAAGQFSLDLPEELIDISDLAPPERDSRAFKAETKRTGTREDADLEMDDLNFDLGLGELGVGVEAGSDQMEETILALDDIDFSEAPAEKKAAKPSSKGAGANMDGDLNFDLDLGGLSIHKDL